MNTIHELTPSIPKEHDDFLDLLPIVQRHAHVAFHHLPAAHREEAVAEAVASSFESFCRLKARGKDPVRDFPSAMAKFGVLSVKNDRHVGGTSSSQDVLSPKAQQMRGFRVEQLPSASGQDSNNLVARTRQECEKYQELLHDSRVWPVPDRVAFRIDFPAFLKTLSRRDRRLLYFLAQGNSGADAARKFHLTEGRIAQLRQQWRLEWNAMHSDETAPNSGTESESDAVSLS
jgi:hypothetical protein